MLPRAAREHCRLAELRVGIAGKVVLDFGEDARPQPARDSYRRKLLRELLPVAHARAPAAPGTKHC